MRLRQIHFPMSGAPSRDLSHYPLRPAASTFTARTGASCSYDLERASSEGLFEQLSDDAGSTWLPSSAIEIAVSPQVCAD